ncbi:MAG: VOC family protein, partial [Anaerolineales bacterium]
MIMMGQIVSLSVYVRDLEEAERFYVERLNFHRRSESPPGSDPRWVTLLHPGGQTELVLSTPAAGAGRTSRERTQGKIGSFTGFVFSTGDIEATYQELSGRGVAFGQIPKREGWG